MSLITDCYGLNVKSHTHTHTGLCVLILGLQMMALFWETKDPLGSMAYLSDWVTGGRPEGYVHFWFCHECSASWSARM